MTRLLYICLKDDIREGINHGVKGYYVQSRNAKAFDWRDESGPHDSHTDALVSAERLSEWYGWAIVNPGLGHGIAQSFKGA